MKTVAIILGTRPEIIKLAPVIRKLQENQVFTPFVLFTGQHRDMGFQAFAPFGIHPDIDLNLMEKNQTPNSFLGKLLPAVEHVLDQKKPVAVIVQGDTTSALGGALAAFHQRIPVAHVEAGLRTYRLDSPFPEEMNRTVISKLSTFHFAPTKQAQQHLAQEGIKENVFIVGNTVVDALLWIQKELQNKNISPESSVIDLALEKKKFILVTGHRRENFDAPLHNLCLVLARLCNKFPDLEIVYPVHLNPNVSEPVKRELQGKPRIHLLNPVDYPSTVYLMERAALIISDSGGIQEEAPSLGTFVLVTRNTTERPEAIEAGGATLCPLQDPENLFAEAVNHLASSPTSQRLIARNPFGDGTASQQIVTVLQNKLLHSAVT